MSKEEKKIETEKLIRLFKKDGGYGVEIIELPKSQVDKAKVIDHWEPDIFAIANVTITKMARKIYEI